MVDSGNRVRTSSMTDKEKEQDVTQPLEETQSTSQGADNTQATSTGNTTTTPTSDLQDGLDDIDHYLRHSKKKVKKFWYSPDIKNNRLRDILGTRLPYEYDPIKIVFNAPELRRFFPTTTFEICLDTSKVCSFTDPRVAIGVSLEPDPFNLEELEAHFWAQTKTTEAIHHMERIPLMERITATTEVMPLREFENNINTYSKLCRMYG